MLIILKIKAFPQISELSSKINAKQLFGFKDENLIDHFLMFTIIFWVFWIVNFVVQIEHYYHYL